MSLYEGQLSENVFKYFEEISNIPRCSFNEKEISDYLVQFAKDRSLEVFQDDIFNVVIKKNATPDLIGAPTIVLQGHTDMVCEKNAITIHNFDSDPIKILVQDENIKADGTTLGADNGLAVAMMLAILDSSEISHPNLECIFTSQEEVGLNGAQFLDPNWISGKTMINLDSEEYGNFLVSCAGGGSVELSLDTNWTILDGNYKILQLKISGLKGGHSGLNIIEERGNAIKILGRMLSELDKEMNFEIQSIQGGSKDNAIPREATANIAIGASKFDLIQNFLEKWQGIINAELRGKDNPAQIQVEEIETDKVTVFNQETKRKIIYLLSTVPNGVNTMSADIDGLVESSKNLGVIMQDSSMTKIIFSVRSSVESLLLKQIDELHQLANILGAKIKVSGIYPGWEYNPVSPIRDLFINVYKAIENKEPKVSAIHAGLECGILSQKLGGLDIISIGPDIFNPHSPDEHANIESIDKTYNLLLSVLKESSKLQ